MLRTEEEIRLQLRSARQRLPLVKQLYRTANQKEDSAAVRVFAAEYGVLATFIATLEWVLGEAPNPPGAQAGS